MNYLLFIIILLICGGGYYEYTTQDQRITDDEQRFTEYDQKVTVLQTDNDKIHTENEKLSKENKDLAASLADAKKKIASAGLAAEQTAAAQAGVSASAIVGSATIASAPSVPVQVTPDQVAQSVVVISGDNAEGTGFLVKTIQGPAVVTNLHVLSNNPHLKITNSNGVAIVVTGMKGASDRDLAMLSIQDGPFTYLPMSTDVTKAAQVNDEVITPGNSQGGNVVINTRGLMVALGPDRIEFNNPVYHGNSGGPVFHTKSGTIIGVVTEAMKVDVSNDLDKSSFASRNSAITSTMRYFGLRLDTVPKWEPYDLRQYENETAFIDDFNTQSEHLDSFLNPTKVSPYQPASNEAMPYETDDKIVAAYQNFRQQLNGTDTGGQLDALHELSFALDAIADKNVLAMQNTNNFYSFDQQRTRDALAYRKALKAEIQEFSNDITRISSMPRTNK